ncbi:uncharacterized protein LOC121878951 [Homarus americanus]|uniref:uncharacterized protein LOC121878951 n=1 Tax=Homarus americanus TaxID=6706 RepID=UPI001C45AC31|nr:uncharacterized protein LOC121878951 [Homarus americanus]
MTEVKETSPLLGRTVTETPKTRFWIVQALADVTVEPAILLHSVAYAIDQVYLTNIIIDKVCLVHFKYDAEVCENLDTGNYTVEQNQVQRLTSDYNVYNHWVEYLPSLVSILIQGAWEDVRGRRLPVLRSFVGSLLTALCFLANAYWWSLPAPFLLLSWVPLGVSGGNIGLNTNACIFVSAVSGSRSRTFRLSAMEWIKYGCYPLAIYLAMIIYSNGGYVTLYGFQVILYIVAVVYLAFCLEEPHSTKLQDEQTSSMSICEVFSTSWLTRTFAVTWRPRAAGGRTTLIANMAILLLVVFSQGVKNYFFLYTRKMFEWEYQNYTDWTLVDYPVKAIAAVHTRGRALYGPCTLEAVHSMDRAL